MHKQSRSDNSPKCPFIVRPIGTPTKLTTLKTQQRQLLPLPIKSSSVKILKRRRFHTQQATCNPTTLLPKSKNPHIAYLNRQQKYSLALSKSGYVRRKSRLANQKKKLEQLFQATQHDIVQNRVHTEQAIDQTVEMLKLQLARKFRMRKSFFQ